MFTAVFCDVYQSDLTYFFDDTKEVGGKKWTGAAPAYNKILH